MSRRFTLGFSVFAVGVLLSGQIARSSLISQNTHALLCMARLAQVAQAAVYYVKSNATGTPHDGTTWNQAFTDLPTAVSSVGNVSGQTDELWVAAVANSPYKPTAGADRTLSIPMKTRVEIYGGFVGNETVRTQRDWVAHETILSGDIGTANDNTDNSWHVVKANGVANTAILDGFTITGGFADGNNQSNDRAGAGIWLASTFSSPFISHCIITGNVANYSSGNAGVGGAIYAAVNSNTSAKFEDCVISDNHSARSGGAVSISSPGAVKFTRCVFSGNSTLSTSASSNNGGGALYFSVSNLVTLDTCTLQSNSTGASPGGAVYVTGSGAFIASDCVFDGNTANGGSLSGQGGGLYSNGTQNTLVNCLFHANKSEQSAQSNAGGGVALAGTSGAQVIVNCQFIANEGNSQGYGGGFYTAKNSDGVAIINCLFAGNKAQFGGAAYCRSAPGLPVIFTNCTVADNVARGPGNTAGGVGGIGLEATDQGKVYNSILWGNTDGSGNPTSQQQIRQDADQAFPVVAYSCVQGGYSGAGGTANISTDPLFFDASHTDAALNNYRLQPCSLASDSADYDALFAAQDPANLDLDTDFTEPTPLDLELVDRWFDNPQRSNDGHGTQGSDPKLFVDMGAFENHAPVCSMPGDLNGDAAVDGRDIQPFVACVLAESQMCPCGDLDLSGRSTRDDIACFAKLLLTNEACGIACDAGQRTFADCNTNGVPDINDIFNGTSQDCNHNDVPDECDLDASDPDGNELVSADVNTNSVPDECEPDCNTNGVPDDWDLSQATSDDVNTNGIPDECEADCNTNGVPDAWDISQATSADCNTNGTPDECEADCNTNGVPDDCDIDPNDPDGDEWVSADCNGNGMPDECDLALPGGWGSLDCNTNGIPDECDIASCESDPACGDCNSNGIPDGCDIAAEVSEDADTNGIPDECEGEGMMGGGSQMMMRGEGGGTPPHPSPSQGEGEEAAWEAYYEWAAAQCWGPACEGPGDVQFAAMVAKLQELGLPVSGRPLMP